jgi:hypothetical protein
MNVVRTGSRRPARIYVVKGAPIYDPSHKVTTGDAHFQPGRRNKFDRLYLSDLDAIWKRNKKRGSLEMTRGEVATARCHDRRRYTLRRMTIP